MHFANQLQNAQHGFSFSHFLKRFSLRTDRMPAGRRSIARERSLAVAERLRGGYIAGGRSPRLPVCAFARLFDPQSYTFFLNMQLFSGIKQKMTRYFSGWRGCNLPNSPNSSALSFQPSFISLYAAAFLEQEAAVLFLPEAEPGSYGSRRGGEIKAEKSGCFLSPSPPYVLLCFWPSPF